MGPRIVGMSPRHSGTSAPTVASAARDTPTVIDGAGIFTHVEEDAPIREFVRSYNPMGRKVEDVANIAEFFASDLRPLRAASTY
jgi:hypothetical protein